MKATITLFTAICALSSSKYKSKSKSFIFKYYRASHKALFLFKRKTWQDKTITTQHTLHMSRELVIYVSKGDVQILIVYTN